MPDEKPDDIDPTTTNKKGRYLSKTFNFGEEHPLRKTHVQILKSNNINPDQIKYYNAKRK